MDVVDALLDKATPNFQRREHLRNVFHEWERVEHLADSHWMDAGSPRRRTSCGCCGEFIRSAGSQETG